MLSAKAAIRTAAAVILLAAGASVAGAAGPTDPQIAHIAYTAGVIDIDNAKLALGKSSNSDVVAFANAMVSDHQAVNDQALALVKKLGVTPEDNQTSRDLTASAEKERAALSALKGDAFDKAYIENEVKYHATVNGALEKTLIPAASNAELKALLQTGLGIFKAHQEHAESLAAELK